MIDINSKEWRINITDREHLKNKGFYYAPKYSDYENSYYTYRFNVAFYKERPVLTAEIIVRQLDGHVEVHVYDTNNEDRIYPAYYSQEYHYPNQVLDQIENRILTKFKKLGISEKKKKKRKSFKYGKDKKHN